MKAMKLILAIAAVAVFASTANASLVINELDYDHDGTDDQEFVELFGTGGEDLTGWELILYNGNGGASYRTVDLSTLGTVPMDGFLVVGSALVANVDIIDWTTNGVQNGAPDGVALVSGGVVQDLLAYEGTFDGVGGPADGMTFPDIGVADHPDPGVGDPELALQLFPDGVGTWIVTEGSARNPGTPGAPNTPEPATMSLLLLGGGLLLRRRR